MNRVYIRLMGVCMSVIGSIWGRQSCALVDTSVYMQCSYSSPASDVPEFVHEGARYNWAACDDGFSDYVVAWGQDMLDNYYECRNIPDADFALRIVTGGSGTDGSICYCDITGIACPRTSMWIEWLSLYGCKSGYSGQVSSNCGFYSNQRGLYMVLTGCITGYAETRVMQQKYLLVSGDYYSQYPFGYCEQCPGLGYSGDAFYEYAPITGMSSSGQFSWGAAPGSGGGCVANVDGSITNSRGTFSLPSGCPYQQ